MEINQIEILLIEDSKEDAEMTIRALKKNNIANRIIHLSDGSEGIEFLFGMGEYEGRNINNKPKVILLDLKMPKVGGIELLEKIKTDENTKTIPVVVLTSSNEHPDLERCYALGVNSYIVKPVNFYDFYKVVNDLGVYWVMLNQPLD